MKIHGVSQPSAILKICSEFFIVHAVGNTGTATFFFTRFTQNIDDATGRVTCQRGRRAAPDRFHALNRCVKTHEVICIGKIDIAKLQYRQPIFMELHIFGTTCCQGNTANGDVGVTTIARRFRTNTRQTSEYFVNRARRHLVNVCPGQCADRNAGIQPGHTRARHTGHKYFFY